MSGWDFGTGGTWSNLLGGGSGYSGGSWSADDWVSSNWMSSVFGGNTSSSSSSWDWLNELGGLFGGSKDSSSSSSSGWGNIFSAMLGGVGGSADAKMAEGMVNKKGEWDIRNTQEQGRQQRMTLDFTEQLEDYNKQKDKYRKRAALDTYGQFSLTDRYAPGGVAAPAVSVPTRPTVS